MPLTADLNIRENITFVALPILYPQVELLNLRLGLGEENRGGVNGKLWGGVGGWVVRLVRA